MEQEDIGGKEQEGSKEVGQVIGIDDYHRQEAIGKKGQDAHGHAPAQRQKGLQHPEKDEHIAPFQPQRQNVKKPYHSKSPQYSVSRSVNSFRLGWLMGRISPVISSSSSFLMPFM